MNRPPNQLNLIKRDLSNLHNSSGYHPLDEGRISPKPQADFSEGKNPEQEDNNILSFSQGKSHEEYHTREYKNFSKRLEGAGYLFYKTVALVFSILLSIGAFIYFVKLFRVSLKRTIPTLFDFLFNAWLAYALWLNNQSIGEKEAYKARKAFNLMAWFVITFTVVHIGLLNFVDPANFLEEYYVRDTPDISKGLIQQLRIVNFGIQEGFWLVFLAGSFKVKSVMMELASIKQKL